jgi:hypothetical protein
MTQATKTWAVSKDALVAQQVGGGTSYGAGKCLHNPLGRSIAGYGPVHHRSFLDFTEDWTGLVQIVKAELKMRRPTGSQLQHVSVGGSAFVRAQMAAAAWSEGTKGSDEQIWTTNSLEWNNQPGVTGPISAATAVPAAGDWISVDITTLIEAIAPPTVKLRSGAAGTGTGTWEGLRTIATDAAGTEQLDASAQASEFFSMQSTSQPYVLVTYDNNSAPATPTITSPTADQVVSTALGTTATIAGTYSDPDGDTFGGGTIQVYDDTATDDGAGNILTGTKIGADRPMVAGDGSGSTWSKPVTALPAQTWLRARAQVKDSKGAYSIYSPLVRFKTNATPGTPTNPFFQDDTVTSPTMAASLVDPDGTTGTPPAAYITAYEPEVYYDHPTLGAITMWAPGKQSVGGTSTRASFTYDGSQLTVGTKYRWRIRLYDNQDAASPWTADQFVTPKLTTGPSNMTPRDVETKQNTRTPTLTIANSSNFDQAAFDVFDNPDGTGTPLWTVPAQTFTTTASKAYTYGNNAGLVGASTAVPLDWGRRYYWRAAVRITGNATIGSYSPLYPFYINSLPAAPVLAASA